MGISTVEASLPEGIQEVVTPYPPTPFQSLLFYCNNPISMGRLNEEAFHRQPHTVLTGPQYSRVNIKVHSRLTAIRVDFVPGGVYRLLGIPMHELFDGGFDASELLGSEIQTINTQIQHAPNLEAAKDIVERYLSCKVSRLKEMLPFDSSMSVLLKSEGKISIEKLASLACLSLKQFERKCKERIGMNPKMYLRVIRFSKAYRLHEASQLNWTKIAYEAGYYDQMHLIRDFKQFAGVTPSVIEQQLLATPLRMQKDLHF